MYHGPVQEHEITENDGHKLPRNTHVHSIIYCEFYTALFMSNEGHHIIYEKALKIQKKRQSDKSHKLKT